MYIILLFIRVYRATLSTFCPYRHKKRPPLTWQPCVLVDAFLFVDGKVIPFGQIQKLSQGLADALSDEAKLAKQLREKYMLNPSEKYTAEEISHMNDDDMIYRLFFEQIKFLYSLQRINAPQFSLYILN